MLINDVLQEASVGWWNKALYILDKIFGFKSDGNSKLKRVKQVFDQKSGEHVIYLEYRVRAANQSPIQTPLIKNSKVKVDKNNKGSK
ncbi:hypothetical protein OIZ54_14455 [Pseudoalteromonas sp. A3]|uniref:hypothetical protein n=1 Tax=Pseudoalteromonas sp. A3 TaxID=142792 RepID=UPI00221E7480|nr:hypothetical protein [Pseudoalteromonas sp. A3]MCW1719941.1 hypothetical protein [Pseudoalteromonas sp. A3]